MKSANKGIATRSVREMLEIIKTLPRVSELSAPQSAYHEIFKVFGSVVSFGPYERFRSLSHLAPTRYAAYLRQNDAVPSVR